MVSLSIKKSIYSACLEKTLDQLNSIKEEIKEINIALGEETKSSAGDKHETGRAMIQLDLERNLQQMREHQQSVATLQSLSSEKPHNVVVRGSLVETNQGVYYLSLGLGKISVAGEDVFVISPVSPIGGLMLGKGIGEEFHFNNRHFKIMEVC